MCEIHSKTPKVIIGGRDQRFCQQCSRFHSLVEFDEGKRSCRKRLDGHNRRRRKPQPSSVSRNSGFISSSQQCTRFYSFGSPQVLASAAVVKPENSTVTYKNQQPSYKAVNQLQFIQGRDPAAIVQETSFCQPFLDPKSASGSSKSFSYQARSLLSSPPPVTREFGLNQAFQTEPMLPQTQSVIQNWLYINDLGPFTLAEDVKPAVSHGGNVSGTLNFPEMFQHGSPTNGSNQTLAFLWE